ncbi:MAG: capsular polysaccharide biosynthesis protein [Clostridiales Family XIII bacterium]|nr:capsular polysaccharide biosynthesis protein [Clostridiales Family XIII bacterium]
MTDFHTHVLPGMDDGSRSAGESAEMLGMLRAQGVTRLIASPHYYRQRETIPEFTERRGHSAEKLAGEAGAAPPPCMVLGAEAAFFADMSKEPGLRRLCIGGTDMLLLEMPFAPWPAAVVNEVYQIVSSRGITPVIAHVERYMEHKRNLEALDRLISFGVVIQSNAEFFLERGTRRRAFGMLAAGRIHVFGSDCHDTHDRPPNMGALAALLKKKLPPGRLEALQAAEDGLFAGQG